MKTLLKPNTFIFLILTAIVIGAVLTGCSSANAQRGTGNGAVNLEEMKMPIWFWHTPRIQGNKLSVGYSKTYYSSESSFEEAFLDGAWRLYHDMGCQVKGGRGTIRAGAWLMSMGSDVDFMVDSSGFESFAEGLVRIDSFATKELTVMLLGLREADVERKVVGSPSLDEFEKKTSRFFVGTGYSEAFYWEVSSWRAAERDARVDAAFAVQSRIKGLDKRFENVADKTIVIETDVQLRFNRSFRSIDPETGIKMVRVFVEE